VKLRGDNKMAKVNKVHCDELFCKYRTENKPHVIAILRDEELIKESDIKCHDSIVNTYVTDYCI
jgi:hypothetical protein